MAEKYGVGGHRSDMQQTACSVCAKPIGKSYFVHLGEVYFHEKCFVTSADHGASAKQVRHLEAAMSALKAVLPLYQHMRATRS